jgi:predicted nuclease with TOPRIM domain
MANEYDKQFEELTGLVRRVAGRVDEMSMEMRDLRQDVTALNSKTDVIGADLKIVKGQVNDLGPKFLADHKRLDRVEERVDDLEAKVH